MSFALVLAGLLTLSAPKTQLDRVAVLVAHGRAALDRDQLRYAHEDAKRLGQVLGDLGGFSDVRYVFDPSADSLDTLLTELREDLEARHFDGELLFYYSGHADDSAFLLGGDRYGFDKLKTRLSEIPSALFVALVDACQSGALARKKGATTVSLLEIDSRAREAAQRGGVLLTSSSAFEASQESDHVEGSFFTHYVVAGLRGAADVSRDQRVSLDEVYQYAYQQTVARTAETLLGAQHPTIDSDLVGKGQLVLSWLSSARGHLHFPAPASGRYLLRSDTGDVVSEVDKTDGHEVMLAVDPGSYSISKISETRIGETKIRVDEGATASLDESSLRWRKRSFAVAKGSPGEQSLALAYAVQSGYLEGSELVQGASLGYHFHRRRWEVGIDARLLFDRYARPSTLEVGLQQYELGGYLGGRWSVGDRWLFGVGAQLAPTLIHQAGQYPGGSAEHNWGFALATRANVSGAVMFGRRVGVQLGLGGGATVYGANESTAVAPLLQSELGLVLFP